MGSVPHIRIEDLTVRYRSLDGPIVAVKGLDIDVPPRSFLSVVGPSGCGKTTLLKVLSGILRPSAGRVLFDGEERDARRLTGQFGYVFQRPLLLPWRTALENVALTAEVARKEISREERTARARHWLALTGLSGFEDKFPHELSGGMQQRVSLSRALALQPPVLMMDEPFAALDEITREQMQEELLKLWSVTESSVIFITHSISEAVLLSERIVVMTARPGRVRQVIDVPFPRPRSEALRSSAEFVGMVRDIRGLLRQEERERAEGVAP